jgi:hypothetical protein
MALQRLADASHRVVSYSQCQTAQSSSFPRALLRPGFYLHLFFAS